MSEKDKVQLDESKHEYEYVAIDRISSDLEKKIDFLQDRIDCMKVMYEADKKQRKINELAKEFLEKHPEGWSIEVLRTHKKGDFLSHGKHEVFFITCEKVYGGLGNYVFSIKKVGYGIVLGYVSIQCYDLSCQKKWVPKYNKMFFDCFDGYDKLIRVGFYNEGRQGGKSFPCGLQEEQTFVLDTETGDYRILYADRATLRNALATLASMYGDWAGFDKLYNKIVKKELNGVFVESEHCTAVGNRAEWNTMTKCESANYLYLWCEEHGVSISKVQGGEYSKPHEAL